MTRYLIPTLLLVATIATAQMLPLPEESQFASVKQEIAFTEIEMEYSRPNIQGRDLFGSMIPWESVWRLGANASTKLHVSRDIFLESNRIPAGVYSMFAIPRATGPWTFIINTDTTLWGHYGYDPQKDLLRFPINIVPLSESYETFTIQFENVTAKGASLVILWGKVKLPIGLQIDEEDFDNEVMASIEIMRQKPLDHDKPIIVGHSYLRAAIYYMDTGRDLLQALAFANQAVELSQVNYFYLYQSEILGKLGRNDEAIAASKIGYDMFYRNGEGTNSEWIWRYQQQIEKWTGLK